jgi:RNA polymerase sigma-70 factor (ECF subfamily)
VFARARRAIDVGRPRFDTSRADAEEVTSIFLDAAGGGDMTALIERLAPDVAFYGDSGGQGEATFTTPIFGRNRIAAILAVQIVRVIEEHASLRPATINGQPGVLSYDADGGVIAAVTFDILDGQVQAIRAVANPDKLRHLGPISRTWHVPKD